MEVQKRSAVRLALLRLVAADGHWEVRQTMSYQRLYSLSLSQMADGLLAVSERPLSILKLRILHAHHSLSLSWSGETRS